MPRCAPPARGDHAPDMARSTKRAVKSATRAPSKALPEFWGWIALGLIVAFYVLVRARLLGVPLERDEGEHAYAGQLVLHGVPPYTLAYNMKLPGSYYAYALVMALFGRNATGIHVGLLLVNAGAIVLLYALARKLFDRTIGLVAAAAYGMLTLTPWSYGPQAHATHFVVLPALGGALLALRATGTRGLRPVVASGLLMGLARHPVDLDAGGARPGADVGGSREPGAGAPRHGVLRVRSAHDLPGPLLPAALLRHVDARDRAPRRGLRGRRPERGSPFQRQSRVRMGACRVLRVHDAVDGRRRRRLPPPHAGGAGQPRHVRTLSLAPIPAGRGVHREPQRTDGRGRRGCGARSRTRR